MEETFFILFIIIAISGFVIENKASKFYSGKPGHRWMHVYVFFPENFKPEGKRFHKYLVIHLVTVIIFVIGFGIYGAISTNT